MGKNKHTLELTTKDNTNSGLSAARNSFKRFDNDIKKITQTFDFIKNSFVAGMIGKMGKAIINFGAECINEFAEVEKQTIRLRSAIDAGGGSFERLSGFVRELAAVSSTSRDEILGVVTTLKQLGKTDTEVENITRAANALSEVTGQSLSEAWKQLNATYTGSRDEIGKLIPEIKTLTTEQLAAGDAIRIVNDKFSQFIDETADSYAQKIKNISDSISGLKQLFGEGMANSLANLGVDEFLSEMEDSLNKAQRLQSFWNTFAKQYDKKTGNASDIITDAFASLPNMEDRLDFLTEFNRYLSGLWGRNGEMSRDLQYIQQLMASVKNNIETAKLAPPKEEPVKPVAVPVAPTKSGAGAPAKPADVGLMPRYDDAIKVKIVDDAGKSGTVNKGAEALGKPDFWEKLMGGLGGFAERILGTFTSLESVTRILDWSGEIIAGIFEVIQPVLDTILNPIIEILQIIGNILGHLMLPQLKFLQPIIEALSKAFLWFYNKVILPVGNFIIRLFGNIGNFFIDMMNGVISALNKIPFVDIGYLSRMNIDSMLMQEIEPGSMTSGTTSPTSTAAGASYASRDVIINYYHTGQLVGTNGMEEFALTIRHILDERGILNR